MIPLDPIKAYPFGWMAKVPPLFSIFPHHIIQVEMVLARLLHHKILTPYPIINWQWRLSLTGQAHHKHYTRLQAQSSPGEYPISPNSCLPFCNDTLSFYSYPIFLPHLFQPDPSIHSWNFTWDNFLTVWLAGALASTNDPHSVQV